MPWLGLYWAAWGRRWVPGRSALGSSSRCPALPRARLPLFGARGRCCSLLLRRQPSGGSRTLQLPTKLPCSPCDVTVVKQRSKPGREWEREGGRAGAGGGGAGSERRGAERGRAQKPSRRRRACPAAELPPKPGFHRNANRPRLPFSPPWKRGAVVSAVPEWVPRDLGVGGGGSAGGTTGVGGRAGHPQPGETAWRGDSGAQRHPISEPGEWAHFRKRHEGTHGRRGGQGTSASTSSFIFINTC